MSEAATRDDIDEVLELLHTFMKQVDERFNEQEKKYDRLFDYNYRWLYIQNR